MPSEIIKSKQSGAGPWRWLAALAARTAIIMVLWLVISEFDGQLVIYGLLTAAAVALLSLRLLPLQTMRLSLIGVTRFLPYFLWRSFLGGLDVAWRACHPRLPISPGMIEHKMSIRSEMEKTLLMLIVSLLPGTLSVRVHNGTLKVHCLDSGSDHAAAVAALEQRISGMFRHAAPPAGNV
jgi:multicomponent Na+:H+ antiporter subunit E